MAIGIVHIEEGVIVISSRDADQFRDGGLGFCSKDMLARNLSILLSDKARRESLSLYEDVRAAAEECHVDAHLTAEGLADWAWDIVGPILGTRCDDQAWPACSFVFVPGEDQVAEGRSEESESSPKKGGIKPLIGCLVNAYNVAA